MDSCQLESLTLGSHPALTHMASPAMVAAVPNAAVITTLACRLGDNRPDITWGIPLEFSGQRGAPRGL